MLNVPGPASGLVPAESMEKSLQTHGRLGWTCPNCWNSNKPEARACAHCGPSLPGASA